MTRRLITASTIAALALGLACGSKPKTKPRAPAANTADTPERATAPVQRTETVSGELAEVIMNLRRVHFGYDGVTLEQPAREALSEASAILVKHPAIHIRVMGHADERGSEEYNIALGERRARAVVDYMARMGVDASRLHIVSFGEERPLADGQDPVAFARNRRVDFDLLRGKARLVLGDGEIDQTNEPGAASRRQARASKAR